MNSEPDAGQSPAKAALPAENDIGCEQLVYEEIFQLRFDLLRNALYHTDQLGFYSGINRSAKFFSVLSSTAVIGFWFAQYPVLASIMAGLVAFLNTIDLVFNVVTRARTHEVFRQKYFSLLADIENSPQSFELVRRVRADMLKMFGEEPVTKWAVDAAAWNQARCTLYPHIDKENDLIPIGSWTLLLRHILPFSQKSFSPPRNM